MTTTMSINSRILVKTRNLSFSSNGVIFQKFTSLSQLTLQWIRKQTAKIVLTIIRLAAVSKPQGMLGYRLQPRIISHTPYLSTRPHAVHRFYPLIAIYFTFHFRL